MILDPTLRGQVSLDLSDGLILLLLFCIFMCITFKTYPSTGTEETIEESSFWDNTSVNWSLVAIGAVGLAVGGER